MKTIKIDIEGMSCPHCKKALETAIGQLERVQAVEVDFEKNQAIVEAEDDMLEAIRTAIEEAGYSVK
ncbi:MAG TPA: cation transporter [Bacillota bacterium]|nr:cation transporter [Bacillota bacterium]HQD20490.1 cation transporter [Bacillota bacterium]